MPKKTLPVLPLRDIVVFPDMVAPLFVGRDKSVAALEMVDEGENEIMLVAQKDPSTDEPTGDDVHALGTVATILQLLKPSFQDLHSFVYSNHQILFLHHLPILIRVFPNHSKCLIYHQLNHPMHLPNRLLRQ